VCPANVSVRGQTMADWFVEEYMLGGSGAGSPHIVGTTASAAASRLGRHKILATSARTSLLFSCSEGITPSSPRVGAAAAQPRTSTRTYSDPPRSRIVITSHTASVYQ
jgi:hypothetical protein